MMPSRMMPSRKPRHAITAGQSENGFTLIELLVSLAILGLIASMVLAGLGTASSIVARGSASTAAIFEIETAQTVIRQRIERLLPVTRVGGSVNEIDVQGTVRALNFDGPPTQSAGVGAIVRYRLALSPAGDLVLYSVPDLAREVDRDGNVLTGWRAQVLLHNIDAIAMSYYGSQQNAVGGGWQSLWQSRPQSPEAIRIMLTFRRGDRRVWPPLIIRPYANANAVCRLDELTGRCEVDQ